MELPRFMGMSLLNYVILLMLLPAFLLDFVDMTLLTTLFLLLLLFLVTRPLTTIPTDTPMISHLTCLSEQAAQNLSKILVPKLLVQNQCWMPYTLFLP